MFVIPSAWSTDGKFVPLVSTTSAGGELVTVTNPSTAVTVTNISTAVTITNPSTAVSLSTDQSAGGLTGTYRLMTTVSGFSTRASKLFSVLVGSTAVGPVFLQLYNATSSGVTAGTTAPKLVLPCKLTSAAITVDPHYPVYLPLTPHGVEFTAGISAAITSLSSNGTMVQGYLTLVHTT